MKRIAPLFSCLALLACSDDAPLGDGQLSVTVAIDAVAPSRVAATGGTEVSVAGKNFPPDAQILVGGQPARGVVWRDDRRITFVAPKLAVGPHDVAVRTRRGDVLAPGALRAVAEDVSFIVPDLPFAELPPDGRDGGTWRVGDVNGDGLDDVVFSRINGEGRYDLLLHLADGGGRALPAFEELSQERAIALLDGDGDGRADVVDEHGFRKSTGEGFAAVVPLVPDGWRIIGAAPLRGRNALVLLVVDAQLVGELSLRRVTFGAGAPAVEPIPPYAVGPAHDFTNQPELLAGLDADGDGEDDVAYLAADRAVILRGPGFVDGWEVTGTFRYLQARATDVDRDGREDLVLGTFEAMQVASNHGAGPELSSPLSVCGADNAQRGFVMAARGVAADRIGVQCPQEARVLRWSAAAHRLTVTGVIDRPTAGARNETILPRFARLHHESSEPGLLVWDQTAGVMRAFWPDRPDPGYEVKGYRAGTPLLPLVSWLVDVGSGRVAGMTGAGTLVARGAGEARLLELPLVTPGEDPVDLAACDIDGDGRDEAVALLTHDRQTYEVAIVGVAADGLALRERFPAPRGGDGYTMRALRAGGGCVLLFLTALSQTIVTRGGAGWEERELAADAVYAKVLYPAETRAGDVDGDGDDDLLVRTNGRLLLGAQRPGATIVWRELMAPAELDDPGAYIPFAIRRGALAFATGGQKLLAEPVRLLRAHLDGERVVIDASAVSLPAPRWITYRVHLADVDGDGADDVIASSESEDLAIGRALPDGGMAPLTLQHLSGGFALLARDLDGDGLADLVLGRGLGIGVSWAKNLAH